MGIAEVWKSIPGYEGFYEVSSLGRVRSLDRELPFNGKTRKHYGRILSPNRSIAGYLSVQLFDYERVPRRSLIHRLVALAFIPNPYNLPEVNHLDFDRANNLPVNLEWVTRSQNMKYSARAGRSNKPKPTVVSDGLVRNVLDMKERGGSQRKIASALGVSASTVQKIWERGASIRTIESCANVHR